jgi:RNA polymerase sigma factor (sigma-70 family)
MVNGRTSGIIRQIARVFQDGTLAGLSDREILARFVDVRDEAAFEALLARHGPMVLNVCRQILRNPDDAEDAFQATFLALACRAGALHVGESLGPWLYTVASRVAARARADRRRRADRERSGGAIPEPVSARDAGSDRDEIPRIVHEELGRLPERLRAPIVLCYLEGLTHDRAARQLRCPVGTVRSRLARARALLHGRIVRRGLATPTLALGGVLASNARAWSVPPHVPRLLVKIATQLAIGTASVDGCGVPARIATLLEGVLNVLRVKKLMSFMAGLAAIGIVAVVAGLSVFSVSGQTGAKPDARPAPKRVQDTLNDDGKAAPGTYVKTYYVGDLLGPYSMGKQPSQGDGDTRRQVDMGPLIDLITTKAARGTWTIRDTQGKEFKVTGEPVVHGPGAARPETVGRITPFFLSISLIIRQTPEGHEEVADLLRKLRRLVYPPGEMEEERLSVAGVAKPALAGQIMRPQGAPVSAPKPDHREAAVSSHPDRNARIRRLLDELRQEVEKLPRDHN